MKETIYVIFKLLFDFALEVWFSICCTGVLKECLVYEMDPAVVLLHPTIGRLHSPSSKQVCTKASIS